MRSKITPLKSIRLKCLDCCGGQYSEVRNCDIQECPLYPFRHGKNPNRVNTSKEPCKMGNIALGRGVFEKECILKEDLGNERTISA